MSTENKDKVEQKDQPKEAEQSAAPAKEAKGKAETAAKAQPTDKPSNCPVCNKVMKNKWYYRNNKYFCCKGCFKTDLKKSKSEANPAEAKSE
jgi:endogenous inhibitor of DNA gyrase (YacG/DUF329 family)